jgi:signal transduction histidine kinase/tetratricopeptide (TPR) repeat protein
MKIFTHSLFTHRRIIIIFLLAIFIPSLIAAYLSLSTFPKRREAVKKLLESNLYISGEAALKSIEGTLLEHEQRALKPENFISLIRSGNTNQTNSNFPIPSGDTAGQLFLIDSDFKIVFPETESENSSGIQWVKNIQSSQYAKSFDKAESYEFSQKDYSRAAELYKECVLSAPSKRDHAIALEGLGHCLLSSGNYAEANKTYNELSQDYGQFQNRAGHPYGIIAMFQLYEIAREKKEEEKSLRILLNLYKQIRDGIWAINQSSYDFCISEIESILDKKLKEGKLPEIQKAFTNIQTQKSRYGQTLLFADFLRRKAIPGIKEKLTLYEAVDKSRTGRFIDEFGNNLSMVSYTVLPDFRSEQTFYGGFCQDLNHLRNQIIPKILEDIIKDSGLNFKIIDESDQNITAGKEELISQEFLALTFRTFPLPWKLLVSHPGIKAIENSARREIFFYGFLLAVIVALMLLGAVLIARDISRESETNRLKTEFVNNISHELKTPLTLIRLYGETLQRKENLTDQEKKESYEIITKESERLSHLINNVLDFSRIEMGRKEFNFTKGYLQDIIRETLESYRYHLEKKGFAIHSEISRDLPEMSFDKEAIASVLINLLSNAMKFSPKKKEVTVKLFGDKGNAVLQVADKGIGIPQKEIPKIFQRFYQAENRIVSEARGSGLGLTLVKHIIEAHGGTIEVESEVGKGSRFTIKIPLCGI